MMLENLANELLLDLFEYFDSIDLIYTFCGLNSRFNNLLFIHFQTHSLDFRSVSKHVFDNICQQHLRYLGNNILSLHLSNSNETPTLAEYFLSRSFALKQFNHLQSLSLYEINSSHTLNRIILQCRDFLDFTHLSITKCKFSWEDDYIYSLINTIWSLSKLSHLKLDILLFEQLKFHYIKIISLSIKHLSINSYSWNFCDLSHLFEYTPYLRYLSTISTNPLTIDLSRVAPLMNELKLSLSGSFNTTRIPFYSTRNLFSRMPNLSYLTIKTTEINFDGNEWKKFLIEYVPKIKVFQLNMELNFDLQIEKEEQVDRLLDSFRTSFWLEEHRWFVCCNWHPSHTNKYDFLYTLSYAFDKYVYNDQICSKTTYPNHLDHSFYNRINTLKLKILEKDSILDFNIVSSKFPNIRHLDLCLSFNNNISSIILSYNHLTSLKISAIPYSDYSNCLVLQMLLDRAPHLYSLSLYQMLFHRSMIYKLTSRSIRRLEFISISTTGCEFLNTGECSTLINSSLSQRCEVLKLGVKNRSDILQIVKTMSHLRLLTIQCKDDIRVCCRSLLSTHGEILKWLQRRLPSTYSITRDIIDKDTIRLWIC